MPVKATHAGGEGGPADGDPGDEQAADHEAAPIGLARGGARPRRSWRAWAAPSAVSPVRGLAARPALRAAASAALAATSLVFLAPVCRSASARSRRIGDLLERGKRARSARRPWRPGRLPAWAPRAWLPRPRVPPAGGAPGRGQLLLERHGTAQGLGRWRNGGRSGAGTPRRAPPRSRFRSRGRVPRQAAAGAGGRRLAAPPARAAASFSLSVSGRAQGGRRRDVGWRGRGSRRRWAATGARSAAEASTSTTSSAGVGAAAAAPLGSACGFAAPPFRAASRISCTLGRFAIAQSKPPIARRTVLPVFHDMQSTPPLKGKRNASSLLAGMSDSSSCGDMLYFRHTQFRNESGFSNVRKSSGSNSQFMEPAIQTPAEPPRRAAGRAWKPAA